MSDANLFEQQRLNRRRSTIVVTIFLLFFAWIGFGGDLAFYLLTAELDPEQYHHTIPWIGIGAIILALGYQLLQFWLNEGQDEPELEAEPEDEPENDSVY